VNDVIRALVKDFEPQFGGIGRPPVTPELFLGDGIARLNADPVRLAKALENVLIVSLEAMPAGGTLTIRTLQKDDVVRIEISHTGGGVGSESVARMFTPCDDSRREVRTEAGLGLATVLSIVSDHGGRIRVDSAPGAGTTFRIALPAAFAPAEPTLAPLAPTLAQFESTAGAAIPAADRAAPTSAAPATATADFAVISVAPADLEEIPKLTEAITPETEVQDTSISSESLPSPAPDPAPEAGSDAATGNLSVALAESEVTESQTGEWEPKGELPEISEGQSAEQATRERRPTIYRNYL
jgi:hypothetical protein